MTYTVESQTSPDDPNCGSPTKLGRLTDSCAEPKFAYCRSGDENKMAIAGTTDFPIVCIGGSAGGLDAYIRLLRNLPADLGIAVVVVNHLRTVDTLLHVILPAHTTMPVSLIT
jgi:chemotaxis response regulator CheB